MAKLYFYYSTMNAGKSTMLLQARYNYEERGMDTLVFKPVIDTRGGSDVVASRIGLSCKSLPEKDMYGQTAAAQTAGRKIHAVFVDEAHFLTKASVRDLCRITDELDIPVMCYGLRTDFRGHLFEGSQWLMAWADKLHEVKTICHCGSKATMVIRVDGEGRRMDDGPQVQIGSTESYVPLCRAHFMEGAA
ncbi:MAG: thymidine kinase [Pseudomonadota bacterium]|nr:thymidine kinase [Pseudomonadota bacterium]